MARAIVVVIDSFGIGAMEDVVTSRPADIGANTCKHLLQACPDLHLPNLEKLGLFNALGEEIAQHKKAQDAKCAKIKLAHFGADTFWGHQELMGSKPLMPTKMPFANKIDDVEDLLSRSGYRCRRLGDGPYCLMVNDALVIGDNLETDLGMVYNVSACLDLIKYAEVLKIGRLVRSVVEVARVIALGGENVSLPQLIAAMECKGNYIGINAPRSGVYNCGYQVTHLGYGVNATRQVPGLLAQVGVPTKLCGKVADIVENTSIGESVIGLVDTQAVLDCAMQQINSTQEGFICINIQETDLAGHEQNAKKYAEKVKLVDDFIARLQPYLTNDDLLIITADHGNDPTIGHSQHTREYVPLLIQGGKFTLKEGEVRSTLADIGATVCAFFNAPLPQFGQPLSY